MESAVPANRTKILVIENNPAAREEILHELYGLSSCEVRTAGTREETLQLLLLYEPAIVISAFAMPGFNEFETLDMVKTHDRNIAFIYVSGSMGEEKAIEAMVRGARDCINKKNLKRLVPAIEREIEQLKKQEEYRREHEELKLFRRILTYSHDAIAIFHKQEGCVFVNNAFTSLYQRLGMSVSEAEEKLFSQLSSLHENLFTEEIEVTDSNGERIFLEQQVFSYFEERRKSSYYVVVQRDITSRKKYEEILVNAREKAEKSDQLKSGFIANIGNELRNPLNAIMGFSGLLASQTDKVKQQEYIHVIQNAGEQLLKLIEDIVELSRIESHQITIREENIQLNELMNELYDYYAFYMGQQKPQIRLICSKGETSPNDVITGDAGRLKQIFTKLIATAYHYTVKGEITFGYRKTGEKILFYVTATGGVFPAEILSCLSGTSSYYESSPGNKYNAHLIGLVISRHLVNLMQGQLWLKSNAGEREEIYFSLPLVTGKANQTKETVSIPDWKNKKILVAEDDETNYLLISEYLKETGCTLLHARDGKEALLMLSQHPDICLVLMDLRMPVMNGIETFEKIKERRISVPVIAQTAFVFNEEREKTLSMGFADYLSKPIQKKILLDKIRKFLP